MLHPNWPLKYETGPRSDWFLFPKMITSDIESYVSLYHSLIWLGEQF